jgi:hypothetical protein
MNDGSAVTYSLRRAEGLFKSRNDLGCQVVEGTQGLPAVESRATGISGRWERLVSSVAGESCCLEAV